MTRYQPEETPFPCIPWYTSLCSKIFKLLPGAFIGQVWVQFTRQSLNKELKLRKEKSFTEEENSSGMPASRIHSFRRFISVYYLLIYLDCPSIWSWHFKDLGVKNDPSPLVMQVRLITMDSSLCGNPHTTTWLRTVAPQWAQLDLK